MVRLCRFESHPGIPLKDHLSAVANMSLERCREIMGNYCNGNGNDDGDDGDICSIAKILGLTHDIGKYTEYFQEHLHGKNGRKYNRELTSHAPLSAIYTGWLLNKLHKDPLTVAIGILCVYSHHGSLDTSIKELDRIIDHVENANFQKQFESFERYMNVITPELQELGLEPLDGFIIDAKNKFKELRRQLFNELSKEVDNIKNNKEAFLRLYRLLLLFSILIDSDKKVTASIQQPQRRNINADLEGYLAKIKMNNNRLDGLRSRIREDVMKNLEKIIGSNIPHILSINAPTGTGKTLLAFTIALKLREEINKRTGKLYRIIYVLPYINIIEQTYSVLSDIIKDKEDITCLLKHHHLYIPESKPNDERPNDDRLMLMESWDSEIIVTTFVQFIETLLGTNNRMLKKFHKLYNAIIILDEIQTIPIDYWLLIREALLALSEYSYIIFMTATKPSIFEEEVYREMLTNKVEYFKQLNRVKYKVHKEPINIEELGKFILTNWDRNSSALVIVNKISTSIELYNKLKALEPSLIPVSKASTFSSYDGSAPYIIYLSTNIVPKERLERIRLINTLINEGRPVIVVSTQLVEAGVDLDFDMVIRDIGPFDSIIQAGGRCNRNWNKDGVVHIVKLRSIRDNDRLDAIDIYGRLTIETVNEIFEDKGEFTEGDVYDMIEKYYKKVSERMNANNSNSSNEYICAVKQLDLCKLSEFHIIKKTPTSSIYIELDKKAQVTLEEFRQLWSQYSEIKDYKEKFNLRSKIRIIRTRMEEYIVETWKNDIPYTIMPEINIIKYISSENIDQYYDYETGLKSRGTDEAYEAYLIL